MKLRRRAVEARYEKEIEEMYRLAEESGGGVHGSF
jgi:hypothetical protein